MYAAEQDCAGLDQHPKGVATAHLIARVVYRMLMYQVEYEPLSVSQYEKRYHDRQVKYLEKKAAKFGFQLTPAAT